MAAAKIGQIQAELATGAAGAAASGTASVSSTETVEQLKTGFITFKTEKYE